VDWYIRVESGNEKVICIMDATKTTETKEKEDSGITVFCAKGSKVRTKKYYVLYDQNEFLSGGELRDE